MKKGIVVLVTGDRKWKKHKIIARELIKLHKKSNIVLIIQGGADGADAMAYDVGQMLGIQVVTFHANWEKFGRAAGPIRNSNQLRFIKPDAVLAFHKNLKKSKGTASQVRMARKKKIKVRVITK